MPQIYFNPSFLSKGTHELYAKLAVVLDDGTCFCAIRKKNGGTLRGQSFKSFDFQKHAGFGAVDLFDNPLCVKTHIGYTNEMMALMNFMVVNFGEIIKNCDFKDRHHLAVAAVKKLAESEKYFKMLEAWFGESVSGKNADESANAERQQEWGDGAARLPEEEEKNDCDDCVAIYNGETGKYYEMKKGTIYPVKFISEKYATLISPTGLPVIPVGELEIFRLSL